MISNRLHKLMLLLLSTCLFIQQVYTMETLKGAFFGKKRDRANQTQYTNEQFDQMDKEEIEKVASRVSIKRVLLQSEIDQDTYDVNEQRGSLTYKWTEHGGKTIIERGINEVFDYLAEVRKNNRHTRGDFTVEEQFVNLMRVQETTRDDISNMQGLPEYEQREVARKNHEEIDLVRNQLKLLSGLEAPTRYEKIKNVDCREFTKDVIGYSDYVKDIVKNDLTEDDISDKKNDLVIGMAEVLTAVNKQYHVYMNDTAISKKDKIIATEIFNAEYKDLQDAFQDFADEECKEQGCADGFVDLITGFLSKATQFSRREHKKDKIVERINKRTEEQEKRNTSK